MFANWSLLIPPEIDKAPEHSPALKKARLTSQTFPRCLSLASTTPKSDPSEIQELDILYALFSTVRKPNDVTHSHLESLNCSFSYDLPLKSLIPQKYHPDETDENSMFNQRKKELAVENQDAYEFLARRRRDVKIGNFYKFFQSVEMVEGLLLSNESELNNAGNGTPGSPSSGSGVSRSTAKFREELLRNFVDPIAWNYDMRIYPPRYPPKLLSKRSLFNVKADFYLFSQPSVIQERKEGIVEGPAIILQTRNDESFTEVDDIVDAVQELSALVNLAQERQKKNMHKKVRYKAIGKDVEVGGDDLFLLSAVNWHMSLSHVYLTDAYIKFIRTGELPSEEYQKANPEWGYCRIGKSRWYSLIEPEGRIEALRIVMAVLAWLRRKD